LLVAFQQLVYGLLRLVRSDRVVGRRKHQMRVLTEGSSEQLESFEIGCIVLGIIWCLIAYAAVIL
jgi:hypothetical protein